MVSINLYQFDLACDLQSTQNFWGLPSNVKGVFTSVWVKNRRCRALKLGLVGQWTKQIWGKPGPSFSTHFYFRSLDPGVDMKGWRAWQGFYLDLQRRIWKGAFLKGLPVQHQVCSFKMLRNYEWNLFCNHIFLLFFFTLKTITNFWTGHQSGHLVPLMHAH